MSASKSFTWTVEPPEPGARVTFVQARSSSVVSGVGAVIVSYPAAQPAGSLSVVVVGWKDPTAQVASVVDAQGHVYELAVGPTSRTEVGSQAIYYASNVERGTGRQPASP